jgi:alpha-galactosidase/6-phospho-beta-glucosidase family protein
MKVDKETLEYVKSLEQKVEIENPCIIDAEKILSLHVNPFPKEGEYYAKKIVKSK